MCWRSWYAAASDHYCDHLVVAEKLETVPEPVLEPDPLPVPKKRRRRWRDAPEVIAWSKAVRARDGECLECGSSDRLHAHHVDTSPSRRTDLTNGRTLCVSCHRKAHPTLPDRLFLAA